MTIDWWTLGFQTVNILVLIWLLSRFFWRPVAAMIALRVTTTQQVIDAAEAKRIEATTALAAIAETRAGFAKERKAILDAAHDDAEREHATALGDAAKEVAALASAGKAQIATDAASAEKAWIDRAGRLAVQIATTLLGGLSGAALRGAFLDRLMRELHDLKPAERKAIAADGAPLDAVSAESLEAAEQEKFGAAVRDALQTKPEITFKVDASLIAGLELRAANVTVSNSLRADLDRILVELTHDDRH